MRASRTGDAGETEELPAPALRRPAPRGLVIRTDDAGRVVAGGAAVLAIALMVLFYALAVAGTAALVWIGLTLLEPVPSIRGRGVIGEALALVLIDAGVTATTAPGEPVRLVRGEEVAEPFLEVAKYLAGEESAEAWRARWEARGLADRELVE